MFFLGVLLLVIGFLLLQFHQQVYNFTGELDFVVRWVPAGTTSFIKLVGVVLVILGMGMMFGLWTWLTQPIADAFSSAFGGKIRQ